MADNKRSSRKLVVIILVLVIGSLGLLAAVCIGGGSLLWRSASDIGDHGVAFLEQLREGDYNAAYDDISPEWQAIQSQEQFNEFFAAVEARLGRLQSWKRTNINFRTSNTGGQASLVYQGVFANGEGRINMELVKNAGEWSVQSYHVSSPLLLDIAGELLGGGEPPEESAP